MNIRMIKTPPTIFSASDVRRENLETILMDIFIGKAVMEAEQPTLEKVFQTLAHDFNIRSENDEKFLLDTVESLSVFDSIDQKTKEALQSIIQNRSRYPNLVIKAKTILFYFARKDLQTRRKNRRKF